MRLYFSHRAAGHPIFILSFEIIHHKGRVRPTPRAQISFWRLPAFNLAKAPRISQNDSPTTF